MKKLIVMLLVGVFLMGSIGLASTRSMGGATGFLQSNPRSVSIWYANTFSERAFWDLRNSPLVPARAVVLWQKWRWDSFPKHGWSGMRTFLYNGRGVPYEWPSHVFLTDRFRGEPARQNWSWNFTVSWWRWPGSRLTIWRELNIYWEIR